MQQTLQTFYQNLDQCYTNGDVDQVERFLLEAEAQDRENTAGAAEIGIAGMMRRFPRFSTRESW